MSAVFLWMALLATPAQVLARPAPQHQEGVRVLSLSEMRAMVGAIHGTALSMASGDAFA